MLFIWVAHALKWVRSVYEKLLDFALLYPVRCLCTASPQWESASVGVSVFSAAPPLTCSVYRSATQSAEQHHLVRMMMSAILQRILQQVQRHPQSFPYALRCHGLAIASASCHLLSQVNNWKGETLPILLDIPDGPLEIICQVAIATCKRPTTFQNSKASTVDHKFAEVW